MQRDTYPFKNFYSKQKMDQLQMNKSGVNFGLLKLVDIISLDLSKKSLDGAVWSLSIFSKKNQKDDSQLLTVCFQLLQAAAT